MKVEVRLFATLAEGVRDARPAQPFGLELYSGSTVSKLIERLGIDPRDVHLVMIDGRVVHDRDQILSDGARIGLFPPVGGG